MGKNSKIEWTDHTFNPWWGCVKVSEGCKNCYAETQANRFGDWWGVGKYRRFFGEKHWNKPIHWNKQAEKEGKRYKVFCGSMCDVFEDNPGLTNERLRLLDLIEKTPNLDWLLLTKRPENVIGKEMVYNDWRLFKFPDNVWMGTTAENQDELNRRLPYLIEIKASVRWLSIEPMIGEIDLQQAGAISRYISGGGCSDLPLSDGLESNGIHWVICGGESGHNARPMHPEWATSLRDQCKAADVPYFFKQWGEWLPSGDMRREIHGVPGRYMWPWAEGEPGDLKGDTTMMCKVGKNIAGSLLDGKEYKEFPAATQ